MYNRKLLLFIIILIALQVLGGCSSQLFDSNPRAEEGIIDLTQLQFENDVVQLDGEWEFYLNQLLEPGELETGVITGYIDIPSSWNKYRTNKESNTGYGYATYRLTFITEENGILALMIPRVCTAYKL